MLLPDGQFMRLVQQLPRHLAVSRLSSRAPRAAPTASFSGSDGAMDKPRFTPSGFVVDAEPEFAPLQLRAIADEARGVGG